MPLKFRISLSNVQNKQQLEQVVDIFTMPRTSFSYFE